MSLFIFNFPSDFRTTLTGIDSLLPGDEASVWDITDPFTSAVVGRQTVFTGFGPDSTDTLAVLQDFAAGTTTFTVYDNNQQIVSHFVMQGDFDLAGGFDLETAIAGLGGHPDYISLDAGNVIEGYGAGDEMLGEGTFHGRGGADKIELEDFFGGLGSATERSVARGGSGGDILKAAVLKSTLRGQGGDDTLVVEFGRSAVFGNSGSDDFIFDNGFWDVTGTAAQATQNLRATVKDFDGTEDVLVFASVDSTMSFGDPVERESLADRFGAGDLSTLANFTEDGVTYSFMENGSGDAVILRTGTDGEGRTYNERVVVQGVGLDEIDRADVFLQDYAADTYEFF